MNKRKIIAILLTFSFVNMNFLPAFAISETKAQKKAELKKEKMLKLKHF